MRTVRLAARARNRPRAALGWVLGVVLLFATTFLIGLRVAGAAPASEVVTERAARALDAESTAQLDADLDLETERDAELELDAGFEPERDIGFDDHGDVRGDDDGDDDGDEPRTRSRDHVARRVSPASRLGRIELSFTWRRADRVSPSPFARHELWLLGTWRR